MEMYAWLNGHMQSNNKMGTQKFDVEKSQKYTGYAASNFRLHKWLECPDVAASFRAIYTGLWLARCISNNFREFTSGKNLGMEISRFEVSANKTRHYRDSVSSDYVSVQSWIDISRFLAKITAFKSFYTYKELKPKTLPGVLWHRTGSR